MELISIIIPVYNVEEYLDKCIQSIVFQTYTNLEILLVDDGSTDQSAKKCDMWAEKDSRINVLHKQNGGLSDARNAGLKIATGEFIGFVDSDDWIAPEMYSKLMEAVYHDNSDIAACSVKMIWEDGHEKMLTPAINSVLDNKEAQRELLLEKKLKHPVWYKLYKRSTINNIEFEKGKYHEDVFWSYQVIGRASKVSVIDFVGYYYWQRSESIMGQKYSIKRLDAMEAYCKRYDYLKKNYPELETLGLCAIWENCIYHGQMILQHLDRNDAEKSFLILESVRKKFPIRYHDYRYQKCTHRLWICLSRLSLPFVCSIRNMLKIGQ